MNAFHIANTQEGARSSILVFVGHISFAVLHDLAVLAINSRDALAVRRHPRAASWQQNMERERASRVCLFLADDGLSGSDPWIAPEKRDSQKVRIRPMRPKATFRERDFTGLGRPACREAVWE